MYIVSCIIQVSFLIYNFLCYPVVSFYPGSVSLRLLFVNLQIISVLFLPNLVSLVLALEF